MLKHSQLTGALLQAASRAKRWRYPLDTTLSVQKASLDMLTPQLVLQMLEGLLHLFHALRPLAGISL